MGKIRLRVLSVFFYLFHRQSTVFKPFQVMRIGATQYMTRARFGECNMIITDITRKK